MNATTGRRVSLPARTPASLLLILGLALAPRPGHAAEPPPPVPANRIELGFEERVRYENYDNATDFSSATADARHQLRFRTRLWAKANLGSKLEAMLGLDNESRKIYTPDAPMKLDEIVFETLYLDYRFSPRVSARVGRQDIRRGDGFLILDGGPLDGSRTAYVNALDVTCALGASKLELLAISDPYRDLYLPVINDKEKPLIETDEQAVGLYFTAGGVAQTALEGYYFLKWEQDDTRSPTGAAHQGDRRVHTLGGRGTRQLGCGWSGAAELAGQAGSQDPSADILAWAVSASAKKTFAGASKPSLSVGYIGLSGDDPETGDVEAWDPLFSRWPKWSDLYIYSLGGEKGSAYWTNLNALQAEFLITPVKPLNLRATYYHLGAFHRWPGNPEIYAGGKTRGDNYQLRADIKVNDSWRGHLVGEWLGPGSFYAGSDGGWFLRAEVIYTLRQPIKF